MQKVLIIFDCDGVLVDSEHISTRVLLAEAAKWGYALSIEDTSTFLRGRKLSDCIDELEERSGIELPENFETDVRAAEQLAFAAELKPVKGVIDALKQIQLPRCVASSAPLHKITNSLRITGLHPYFGHNIFSSYEVGSWKPSPGLFLHAATAMGFSPTQCIVVEDSLPGVQAGAAAGMRVLAYVGEKQAEPLRDAGALVFSRMEMLPSLVEAQTCDR